MEAVEKIGALCRKYKKGLVAPFWLPKECDSPSKVIAVAVRAAHQARRDDLLRHRGPDADPRIFRDWMPLREHNAD